jgi:hypothetical protein
MKSKVNASAYIMPRQPEDMLREKDRQIAELKSAIGNAFIDGAKWWEFESTGGTMWQSDQQKAAEEAIKRKMPFRPVIETRLEQKLETATNGLKEINDHIEDNKSDCKICFDVGYMTKVILHKLGVKGVRGTKGDPK